MILELPWITSSRKEKLTSWADPLMSRVLNGNNKKTAALVLHCVTLLGTEHDLIRSN